MHKQLQFFIVALLLFTTSCNTLQPSSEPSVTPLTETETLEEFSNASPTPHTPKTPIPTTTPTKSPTPSPTLTPASPIHPVTPHDDIPTGTIRNLWVDPDGSLWVASEAGIFVHRDDDWDIVYNGSVERLQGADPDGRIWAILDGETSIAAYNSSGTWSIYGADQGWTVPPSENYLSPGYGDGIVTDPQGWVWLATGRDDLRRFDPNSQTWKVFHAIDIGFEPPAEEGYQGHFLSDVELSRNQKIWVGNCIGVGEVLSGQGIRWSDGDSWFDAPDTAGECIQDIEIDTAGRMWVGGFDALLQYDPSSGSWSRIPLPPWERRQLVWNITLDERDNPWVEILRYGGASPLGEVVRYHWQDGDWIKDYEGWFSSLALGEDGVAWLCSEGSVYRSKNGQVEDVDTLPGTSCQIVVDGAGRVWVTNYYDLWWIDPRK